MTAEIAIMNKEAIALAADSAVTMSSEEGQKIFTSANKLFALSKYHPIGIMVYGSAIFMGIPWESIIKIYRNKLGRKKFSTLEEYAKHFITFLDNGNSLFPKTEQEKCLRGIVVGYFKLIEGDIKKKVKLQMDNPGGIKDSLVKEIVSSVISNHCEKLEKRKKLPSISPNYSKNLIRKYRNIIDKARNQVFGKLPIFSGSINQLRSIAENLFLKDIFPENISGVVIAGFGEKDTFPSLNSFKIHSIIDNKLRYNHLGKSSDRINFEKHAVIIPFAQGEMVQTFMTGIDPYL